MIYVMIKFVYIECFDLNLVYRMWLYRLLNVKFKKKRFKNNFNMKY